MKYYLATVMIGVPEGITQDWSEGSDLTFHLARLLHDPKKDVFLIGHGDREAYDVDNLKYKVITEEGGV